MMCGPFPSFPMGWLRQVSAWWLPSRPRSWDPLRPRSKSPAMPWSWALGGNDDSPIAIEVVESGKFEPVFGGKPYWDLLQKSGCPGIFSTPLTSCWSSARWFGIRPESLSGRWMSKRAVTMIQADASIGLPDQPTFCRRTRTYIYIYIYICILCIHIYIYIYV